MSNLPHSEPLTEDDSRKKIPWFFLLLSLSIHALLLWGLSHVELKKDEKKTRVRHVPIKIHKVTKKETPKEEEKAKGQIVELPEPEIEVEPEKAKYLSEKAHKVKKETKIDEYKQFSENI